MEKISYTPGLVDFPELTLTNTDGSQTENISNIVAELSYYEDIFSPAISCSILLVDAISLKESLPICLVFQGNGYHRMYLVRDKAAPLSDAQVRRQS